MKPTASTKPTASASTKPSVKATPTPRPSKSASALKKSPATATPAARKTGAAEKTATAKKTATAEKTTPAPVAPSTTPAAVGGDPQNCTISIDGVNVKLSAKAQTATLVKSKGKTTATVTMVTRTPRTACGVTTVFKDTTGRLGYGGIVAAANRRQDTGTTPGGTFTITEAFGLNGNPGTALPYRVPGANSYWVLDSQSSAYNKWAEKGSVKFDPSEGERLRDFPGQYDYAAVINYNRNGVKGKGGAIFLHVHVHGRGATAGCVSIDHQGQHGHVPQDRHLRRHHHHHQVTRTVIATTWS